MTQRNRVDDLLYDDGRVFPMTADPRLLLEHQDQTRQSLARQGIIVPWVFYRMVAEHRGGPKKPQPIRTFVKASARPPKDQSCATREANALDPPAARVDRRSARAP